jgi:hypothetical protein
MKVKMKLDSTQMKAFFLAHAEKIALVVVGLVFVQMCYGAYKTKPYSAESPTHDPERNTPKGLNKLVNDMRAQIEALVWQPADHGITIPEPEFEVQIEKAAKIVDPALYAFNQPWNPPVSQNKVRRDEPAYLPVLELVGSYGFGYVPHKTATTEPGKQWIVVTGLIPVGEQTTAYNEKFENALQKYADKDVPKYDDFVLERADVTGLAAGAQPKWEIVDLDAAFKLDQQFAPERQEFVDKKLVEPLEPYRCPPLLGTPDPVLGTLHNKSVAHPPQIEFVPPSNDKAAAAPAPAAAEAAADRRGRRDAPAAPAIPVPVVNNQAAAPVAPPTFRLFRFFDYTVKNDHAYQYRVQLILKNPNHDVPKRFLKDEKLAEGETRTTPFSAPTGKITVPSDFRLLVGDVAPGRGANEPRAKYIAIKWVPLYGVEVSHEFNDVKEASPSAMKYRGAIMNDVDVPSVIQVAGKPGTTTNGNVTYATGTMLVDMTGGEAVPGPNSRPVKAPSEMVLLNRDGSLSIRNQLIDGVGYTREQDKTKAGAPVAQDGGQPAAPGAPGAAPPPAKKDSFFDQFKKP